MFIDLFPVLVFFTAYYLTKGTPQGFYIATIATVFAASLQLIVSRLLYKRFDKMHLATFVIIVLLGGITLFLHNELFFKWKPTIVNWLFALVILVSWFFLKKNLIRAMLEKKLTLPNLVWDRLNFSWALFFLLVGGLNLVVVYNYSTSAWVNFKLFGMLGLSLLFVAGQGFYVAKFADKDN